MATASTWIILAAGLLLIVTVAKAAMDGIRRRRQFATLMGRLEELETRLASAGIPVVESAQVEESGSSLIEVYSADVLAGQSSHVAKLISGATGPMGLADQAVVSIYRHLEEPIRPSDLADDLCVSLRTLERGLVCSLDCTPSQLIFTIKMREARRLIVSGQMRVGEVAHCLAFSDAAHLSRRYRKFYRCPPSQHMPLASRSSSAH